MVKARESRRIKSCETKTGTKTLVFLNMTDIRKSQKVKLDDVDVVPKNISKHNEIRERVQSDICKLYKCHNVPVVVYHVKSLKSLNGKYAWEQKMLSIRRKTLIVCETCHNKIYNRTLFVNRH